MALVGLGILLVFALLVIILLTRGVFARDLTQALKRVNQQEQALQEKADILEQRLRQMELEYQAKLKRGDAEAQRMVQEAKSQASNIRTVAIEEAKHRARQVLLEAEQGRQQLTLELTKELNGKVIQHACESLRALLPSTELSALHHSMTAELLEALSHLDARPLRGVAHVDVTTAQPLTASESERLKRWAAASVGEGTPVQVDTDPTLVAGCVVRLGATIVDNSLSNRLSRP